MKIHRLILCCLFILGLTGNPSLGQSATGRITGVVGDPTGGRLPGVTVMALNSQTGIEYETVTSDRGVYLFEAIPPGNYTVRAELAGFKTYVSRDNSVTANITHTLNISMDVGEVTEEVVVEGGYEAVQMTQSGNIGAIVNQKTLENLPLPITSSSPRNPLSLVLLQAGVADGANTGGGTHIHGARDRAINITIDGIDANETSAGNATFSPLKTNPDMLAEYRVVTSNASAEFGRNSGAQVALVTRSGTNDFHGTVFYFHQNPVLNANSFERNRLGLPREFDLRHQGGFSVGGPIIKNRTHFFFNYGRLLPSLRRASSTPRMPETGFSAT